MSILLCDCPLGEGALIEAHRCSGCQVQRLRLAINRNDHCAVGERELRDFVAKRLADYKVPESYSLGSEPLPRNANGKLMKRLLRDRLPAA